MNHKLVFRQYGVRRPLKWRRRVAREGLRLWKQMGSHARNENGWHMRWWWLGQDRLWLEERRKGAGDSSR